MRYAASLGLAATLLSLTANAAEPETAKSERVFRAGAARANITPPLGSLIVGGWKPMPAKHIHDDLWVRCLVLDDGKTKLAFAICDNLGMVREVFDEAKRRAEEATGIPAHCMLMAATHSHSAASARADNRYLPDQPIDGYPEFIIDRIVDGLVCAVNNLEPAEIGWAMTEDPRHVFNRRWFMKPGTPTPNPFGGTDQAVMNPGSKNLLKPAGPTDPQINFLSVRSTEGRPIALLANYSLHYVGGVPSSDISADYFGMFADRIQELLGADRLQPPFVGSLTNGASGDVNNINFLNRSKRKPPYEQMRYVADEVAKKVHAAEQKMIYHKWVPLNAAASELTLETRRPTTEQLARAEKVVADPESVELYHRHEPTYAKRMLQLKDVPNTRDIPLTALRIGDLGIVAIPFEVFAEIGLGIRERSPLATTFTISHAGGSFGYLPTEPQHALGGYETWLGTNFVQKDAAARISDRLIEMLEQLK
jgi:hypothetical protein